MTGTDRLQRQLVAALRKALAGGKPVVPEAGRLLWSWFLDLNSSRSGNGFGPNPISWQEIEAWARVRRWPLSDAHIDILRAMDRAWLDHAYAKQHDSPAGMPRSSGQAINAAAFDAVFG